MFLSHAWSCYGWQRQEFRLEWGDKQTYPHMIGTVSAVKETAEHKDPEGWEDMFQLR